MVALPFSTQSKQNRQGHSEQRRGSSPALHLKAHPSHTERIPLLDAPALRPRGDFERRLPFFTSASSASAWAFRRLSPRTKRWARRTAEHSSQAVNSVCSGPRTFFKHCGHAGARQSPHVSIFSCSLPLPSQKEQGNILGERRSERKRKEKSRRRKRRRHTPCPRQTKYPLLFKIQNQF